MNIEDQITHLKNSAAVIAGIVAGISQEQSQWRPDHNSWSVLEVINHLYDEEREDFRVRLDIILRRSLEPWPAIDPGGWITSRKYNERDLADSLAKFLSERDQSIAWLESLEDPDLAIDVKARFGRMAAGDMLLSWVSHDLLHIRQIMELKYAYLSMENAPFRADYAGEFVE